MQATTRTPRFFPSSASSRKRARSRCGPLSSQTDPCSSSLGRSDFRKVFGRFAPVEHAVVANDADPAQARAWRQLGGEFERFGGRAGAPRLKHDQITRSEDRVE